MRLCQLPDSTADSILALPPARGEVVIGILDHRGHVVRRVHRMYKVLRARNISGIVNPEGFFSALANVPLARARHSDVLGYRQYISHSSTGVLRGSSLRGS
jgi:hypothetical protein